MSRRSSLKNLSRPKTEIMINLGNPEVAFSTSMIPNDGVGLARLEFIISSYIKIHPMALIHPEKVNGRSHAGKKIEDLTFGYDDKKEYFVEKLAQGIGTLAAAFYPRPVVVRLSDFKSNEYANLIGGQDSLSWRKIIPCWGSGEHLDTTMIGTERVLPWSVPPSKESGKSWVSIM